MVTNPQIDKQLPISSSLRPNPNTCISSFRVLGPTSHRVRVLHESLSAPCHFPHWGHGTYSKACFFVGWHGALAIFLCTCFFFVSAMRYLCSFFLLGTFIFRVLFMIVMVLFTHEGLVLCCLSDFVRSSRMWLVSPVFIHNLHSYWYARCSMI